MLTQGTAFIGRRKSVIADFGQERWKVFLADYAKVDTYFKKPILATTSMPSEKFLAMNDRVVALFYGGDMAKYWDFGEESAAWILTEGPYKSFLAKREVDRFAEQVPLVWRAYHDSGDCWAKLHANGDIDINMQGVPIKHLYFEYTLVGFLKVAFELVISKKLVSQRVRGFSKGDDDVLYTLRRAGD